MDKKSYEILNTQLEQSTKIIEQGSTYFLMRLEQMTNDPMTAVRASVWNKKASNIHLLSENLMIYIENMKSKLDSTGKIYESEQLFEKLKAYQENVINIDSEIIKYFHKEINSLTNNPDSIPQSAKNFQDTFFSVTSLDAQKSILSRFQNNIAIIENFVVGFCSAQVGSSGGGYIIYEPIVSQNATHLKPGDKLEIKAGVGTYWLRFNPKVEINGKSIEIDKSGKFIHSIDVLGKIGKYSIPIKIEYYDLSDKKIQKTLDVEYYIDK